MKARSNVLIIIAAGLGVYLNSFSNGFVWDDVALIVNNDFIKGLALIKEIVSRPLYYLCGDQAFYYRPLQTLSYVFDYLFSGLNPAVFHFTNLLLHILASLLVYRFIDTVLDDQDCSLFSALLFTVHPLNTSVVDYLSSRADILLLIFTTAALILFMASSNRSYFFSLLCFILALLSKEVAVIFPLVLVFIQETRFKIEGIKRSQRFKTRAWYLVFIAASLGYLILRIKIINIGTNVLFPAGVTSWNVIFSAASITLSYLKLIFLPFGLHMLRNIPLTALTANTLILGSLFIFVSAAAVNIIYRINKRALLLLGFSILWLLPALLLSFKNPEYYLQGKVIMEEHWLYLPLMSVLALLVLLLKFLTARARRVFYFSVGCLLICFSIITVKKNLIWKNNYTLFSHILKYVDNSVTAYRNMALVYLNRGQNQEAIDTYRLALEIKQSDISKAAIYRDIARAYLVSNRLPEAQENLNKAIAINPDDADGYAVGGLVYAAKGELKKAGQYWQTTLNISPFNTIALDRLISLSISDDAIREYLIEKYQGLFGGREIFTDYKIYRALGLVYLYSNKYSYAFTSFRKALKINPYDPKSNSGIAVCFARSGDSESAVLFFKKAIKLNPFDPEGYLNLAQLCREINMPKEAEQLMHKSAAQNIFN